jgi:hypothetical protein
MALIPPPPDPLKMRDQVERDIRAGLSAGQTGEVYEFTVAGHLIKDEGRNLGPQLNAELRQVGSDIRMAWNDKIHKPYLGIIRSEEALSLPDGGQRYLVIFKKGGTLSETPRWIEVNRADDALTTFVFEESRPSRNNKSDNEKRTSYS